MGWDHQLAKRFKEAGKTEGNPIYLSGSVITAEGELKVSLYDGNAFLGSDQLEYLAGVGTLAPGMRVALLPGPRFLHGGQKFLVLGVITDAV